MSDSYAMCCSGEMARARDEVVGGLDICNKLIVAHKLSKHDSSRYPCPHLTVCCCCCPHLQSAGKEQSKKALSTAKKPDSLFGKLVDKVQQFTTMSPEAIQAKAYT